MTASTMTKPTETTKPKTPVSKYEAFLASRTKGYSFDEVTPRTIETDPSESAKIIGRIKPHKGAPKKNLSPAELRSIRLAQTRELARMKRERQKRDAKLYADSPVASAMPATNEGTLSPKAKIVLNGRNKNGRIVSVREQLATIEAASKKKQNRPKKAKKEKYPNAYFKFLAKRKAEINSAD